jgi:ABC-type Fe3+ transport system substrate-binding protein
MKQRHGFPLIPLLPVALLIASCTSATSPSPSPSGAGPSVVASPSPEVSASPQASASAADWQTGAGPDWEKTLAAARQEGSVVVAGYPDLGKPIAEAFKRDTGITLTWYGGFDWETRYTNEARARNLSIDVLLGGATPTLTLLPEGLLQPIKPQLMLPSVTDPANWRGGALHWVDTQQTYMWALSSYVYDWVVVNSSIIDPKTITSAKDLLKPQYKGKIASQEARSPGSGQAQAAHFADRFGLDFIKQLYVDQRVVETPNYGQVEQWAARGTYPIALGAIQSYVEQYKAQGIPLAILDLSDDPGGVLGGFSVMIEARGVPHPAAATVFINWFGTKAAQEINSSVLLETSTRADVLPSNLPQYVIPKAGVNYTDEYAELWYTRVRPVVIAGIRKLLGNP